MRKILYIAREMIVLMRRERLWLLSFVLLMLCLVAIIVFQVTPITVVTFIYAGI